jgi:FMN phosphatase YigB (HAD superfamily)
MVEPLASWTDGAAKVAIVEFVEGVTTPGSDDHVPPAERVAVFDNDGTLWCEKPMPIQLDFTIRRLAELARDDPALRERQPYKAAFDQDHHWLGAAMVKHYRGDDGDLVLLKGAVERAFEAISVQDYDRRVTSFFDEAVHPTLGHPYRACGYVPMVELLRYLEANGFTTYIASGGDRDFMRSVADQLYGIPPERVIGSALGLAYREEGDSNQLLYKAAIEFFDDGPEKPVRIWNGSADVRCSQWETPTETPPCWSSLISPTGRPCGCSSCMTTQSESSTTGLGPSRHSAKLRPTGGPW